MAGKASALCILGYSVSSAAILLACEVSPWSFEWLVAMAGAIPLALHCAALDLEGR